MLDCSPQQVLMGAARCAACCAACCAHAAQCRAMLLFAAVHTRAYACDAYPPAIPGHAGFYTFVEVGVANTQTRAEVST